MFITIHPDNRVTVEMTADDARDLKMRLKATVETLQANLELAEDSNYDDVPEIEAERGQYREDIPYWSAIMDQLPG